ncbi:hypothetical protein FRB91_004125 [Serendipita sp. 411]|nr:hypothetical protein FRB91_004125 [Serendipita sp. 411]
MAPGDYVDAKGTNMYNEIELSANTLLPCPHTNPRRLVEAGFEHIIITTEQDPSYESAEPFVRPGSRIGFSSNRRKYGSIRVIDDEYEMEGAAAGLDMRKHKPLSNCSTTSFWPLLVSSTHEDETPFNISNFVVTPPASSPETENSSNSSPFEDESDVCETDGEVNRGDMEDFSPKSPYDWAKAGHLFAQWSDTRSEQSDKHPVNRRRTNSVNNRRKRSFLEVPSLWTIEEASDGEI